MNLYAVQLLTADTAVSVTSFDETVTDWCRHSAEPGWEVREMGPDSECVGPLVIADVDPDVYADLAARIVRSGYRATTYGGARVLVARAEGTGVVTAVCPEENLAYRSDPDTGVVSVCGCEERLVAGAAARLVEEAVRKGAFLGGLGDPAPVPPPFATR